MIALVAAAWGCTCRADDDHLAESVRAADQVFVGLVEPVERRMERMIERDVRVLVAFKGVVAGSRVVVTTRAGSCALGLGRGQWWVLFVRGGRVGKCTRSTRLGQNQDLLRDLWIEKEVSPALFESG